MLQIEIELTSARREGEQAAERAVRFQIRPYPPDFYTERMVREWYSGLLSRAATIARVTKVRAHASAHGAR